MNEKFWFLKHCGLFERLSDEQVRRLESRSQSRTFERNSLVYLPSDADDAVLLLVSGRIKLYHITGEGKQTVLALIEPGELFGELSLLNPGQREEFAETMEPSTVVLVPGDEIRRLMEQHPEVTLGITRLIGLRRRRIERRLKSLLFHSNRERLVHLLLELAEKYGRPTEQGLQIGVKLSHQDLAGIIGSTRETVTVLLGELQKEGSLLIKRRQLVLTQVERLSATIEFEPSPLPTAGTTASNQFVGEPQMRT